MTKAAEHSGCEREHEFVLAALDDLREAVGFASEIEAAWNRGAATDEWLLRGLTIAAVVSYWRPFSRADGFEKGDFPSYAKKKLDEDELRFHIHIGELRNTELAHTDASPLAPETVKETSGAVSTYLKATRFPLTADEARRLQSLARRVSSNLEQRDQLLTRRLLGLPERSSVPAKNIEGAR